MDWELRYQQNDIPWEKGGPAPALVQWLESHAMHGNILVPGCGSGHDVRAIARVTGANVIGLDIAPSAINLADSQPRVGPEHYRLANLFELPPEMINAFDWVFEHTCFCAIDLSLRSDYVAAVSAALKPGGHLLAIFYLDPNHDEPGPPYGITREELDCLFSPAFDFLKETVPNVAYPGRENRELLRLLVKK